eukprot:1180534-Prorocentrum_minimum.AAC.1
MDAPSDTPTASSGLLGRARRMAAIASATSPVYPAVYGLGEVSGDPEQLQWHSAVQCGTVRYSEVQCAATKNT